MALIHGSQERLIRSRYYIMLKDIQKSDNFKSERGAHQRFQEEPKLKTSKKWTDEGKEARRKQTRGYWEIIKARVSKQLN